MVIGDREVVKRYRSWERDEPQREWIGLSLLHRLVPGLAPEPLRQRTDDGVPVIVMSRVAGEPLGSAPLTAAQVGGAGEPLRRMYTAVPAQELTGLAERNWGPAQLVNELRSWSRKPRGPLSPLVESALAAADDWVNGPESAALSAPLVERVFTNADGNIGNFLWDGNRCSWWTSRTAVSAIRRSRSLTWSNTCLCRYLACSTPKPWCHSWRSPQSSDSAWPGIDD